MSDLNVMTFNLRGCVFNDGDNVWSNRALLATTVVREWEPDILGLQEAQEGNLDTFSEALSGYERKDGLRYNNRDPFAWNAVYWKNDRLKLLRSGGFWLSQTPEEFSGDWGTDCIRSAHWLEFETIPGAERVFYLNTHLDHISSEARIEGARLIAGRLRELAGKETPVIITGDFNCGPDSPAYLVFKEQGFRDTHLEAGNSENDEDASTFHGFTGKPSHGKGRIDWILIRGGLKTRNCEIIHQAKPPVYPSDHFPVAAKLRVEG